MSSFTLTEDSVEDSAVALRDMTALRSAVDMLCGLGSALGTVDLSACDHQQLQTLADAHRHARTALDGFAARLGIAADAAAHAGRGLGAPDLLAGRAGSARRHTVRREAARSRTAARFPAFAEGVASGLIGGDQLDSLAQAARGLDDAERARLNTSELARLNTSELARAATEMSADSFDAKVRDAAERIKADNGLSAAEAARRASGFRHWFDHRTQMGRFSGSLDPERYEILQTAVEQTMSVLANASDEPVRKDENLAAAALVHIVESRGGGNGPQPNPGLPLITVVVDADTLTGGAHDQSIRQTGNGHAVAPETLSRLACHAHLQRVMADDNGLPLNVGRKYRTATPAQWAALRAIHSTCAWKGCDAPISWCQIHHIHEWEHGGRTDLCKLIPLCHRHHHQVHEGQWSVRLLADRRLRIYHPDGALWAETKIPGRMSEAARDGP